MGMEGLEEGERPKLQEMLWNFWKEVGPIKQAILQIAFSSQWYVFLGVAVEQGTGRRGKQGKVPQF